MFPKCSATFLVLFAALAQASPTVKFGNTTVTGVAVDNVEFYGGIPYAELPVGSLRFKPPVLKNSLDSATFDASAYGLPCLQDPSNTLGSVLLSSEDCLTINIYKPGGLAETESLPVMAFVHGGGFVAGSATIYNATGIVERSLIRGTPVIYVSFQYRLGPLGFATGREAFAENSLNLGLRDQLMALQWVQNNIVAFNGDRSKVAVFGESAGAVSIAVLFFNSNLEQFARAAIFESGGAGTTPVFDSSRRQADWDNFVRAVPDCAGSLQGGSSLACLRGVNSTVLLDAIITSSAQANEPYPWSPVIDGPGGLLPDLPSVLLEQGSFARVPFITGTNLDEGTFFTTPLTNSTDMIRAYLISNYTSPAVAEEQLTSAVEELLRLYPDVSALGSPFNTGNETFGLSSQYKRYSAIMGDLMFQSQRRAWIQAASRVSVKTFGYLFTDPAPPIVLPTLGNQPASLDALGVTHTVELPYVYGLEPSLGRPASAIELGTRMIDYWLSFATSLDPNDETGSDRPVWSPYTPSNQTLLKLNGNDTTMILDDYRAEQIGFINANAAVFSQ